MCGIKRSGSDWQNRGDWITEMTYAGDNVQPLAPSGGKALSAPCGGNQSHPLWGWILYFPPLRPARDGWVGENSKLKTENSKLQNVRARYELKTTVMLLNGIKIAAKSGLMWPVMAKLTATTL